MTCNGNANELNAFANNDSQTYKQLVCCFQNLERKKAKGTYDSEKAVKLFTYAAETAAKRYFAEYCNGGTWHAMFPVQDRVAAAKLMRDDFECEIEAGNSWL